MVTAIKDDFAVLASSDATDSEKLEALKFLGPWVGDVHQPLHVWFEHDQGGNGVNTPVLLARTCMLSGTDASSSNASTWTRSRSCANSMLASPTSSEPRPGDGGGAMICGLRRGGEGGRCFERRLGRGRSGRERGEADHVGDQVGEPEPPVARGEAERANDDAEPALLGGEDQLATAAHRLHSDPRREPPLMAILALSSALRTGSSMCPIGLVARFAICFADGRVQAQSQVSGCSASRSALFFRQAIPDAMRRLIGFDAIFNKNQRFNNSCFIALWRLWIHHPRFSPPRFVWPASSFHTGHALFSRTGRGSRWRAH